MMAEKAMAMGDERSRALPLAAEYDPAEFKMLGRLIAPWSQEIGDDAREAVITRGNLLKFGQNAALGEVLLSTGDLVLAEAAKHDLIWGIGLDLRDAQAGHAWRGLNLLGKCLMAVREKLARRTREPGSDPGPQPPAEAGADGDADATGPQQAQLQQQQHEAWLQQERRRELRPQQRQQQQQQRQQQQQTEPPHDERRQEAARDDGT